MQRRVLQVLPERSRIELVAARLGLGKRVLHQPLIDALELVAGLALAADVDLREWRRAAAGGGRDHFAGGQLAADFTAARAGFPIKRQFCRLIGDTRKML